MSIRQKRWWVALFFVAVISVAALGLSRTQTVYADYTPTGSTCDDGSTPSSTTPPGASNPTLSCPDNTKRGTDPANPNPDKDDKTTNCAVEKIGWFVCPVLEQAAKISDNAFSVLADNFLRTDPQLVSPNSGTKTAWEVARNLANIMFIIAFLAIIVSQVTGMGINNYGIKKMIPRLLVAAIAVNVSYYVCQLIVDLTNILGYEIQAALAGIADSIGPSVFGKASTYGVVNKSNGGWGNLAEYLVLGALAAAGIVWLIMGPLMAVIMMVLITALTIVIILLLRKALIVLLIVISPIAFVLYLLPNTERLFKKWMDMFVKILLVFPIVGLLFGAGQLASTIILVAGAQSEQQARAAQECNPDEKAQKDAFQKGLNGSKPGIYDNCGVPSLNIVGTKNGEVGPVGGAGSHRTASLMLGLVAMGVAVAPLIAVWSVLKGALGAAGAIGGKIQAGITKGGGNVMKRAEAADQARQNRMALRAMQDRSFSNPLYKRRAKRDAIRGGVEKELKRQQASYISGELTGDDADTSLQRKMAGGTMVRRANADSMDRVAADAASTQRSLLSDEIKAAHLEIDTMTNSSDVMAIIEDQNRNDTDPKLLAALERITQIGGADELARAAAARASSGTSTVASQTFGSALSSNNPGYFSSMQLDLMKNGQAGGVQGYQDKMMESVTKGIFSESAMASASPSHLSDAVRIAKQRAQAGDDAALKTLQGTAQKLQSNATLKGTIGRSRDVVNQLHPPSNP